MAHSLSTECTPLKLSYDSCFNAWFAGYLEPALSAQQQREKDRNPEAYAKQKAEEYQEKCGKIWESYRDCVQVRDYILTRRVAHHTSLQRAIKEKGLTELLDQAREENPLKDPTPVDPSAQGEQSSASH
jgi:TRIAP1/MDM35 family protein